MSDRRPRQVNIANIKGPKGDSAYQVAVKNGFVGTEAEWLESLARKTLPGATSQELIDHILNPNPHPAYDEDLTDLSIVFDNLLA